MSREVLDEVAVADDARVYAEGWQSWSPTTWYAAGAPGHRPQHDWQRVMRFRPGADPPETGLQGEGLLVLEPGAGEPTRLYAAAAATETVPTLRVAPVDGALRVTADGPVDVHVEAGGGERALARFGDRFGAAAGVGRGTGPGQLRGARHAPRAWCSWYRYFEEVRADDVRENLAALDEHDLPVEVVQVDDGWGSGIGDGARPSDRFPDLAGLAAEIRGSGRHAGIWLAPFLVGADTDLARRHPDWLLDGDAGHNWGQPLRGLDLTHPGVREHLFTTLRRLADQGFDYLKLDFMYAGALPGCRHEDVSPVAAYRSGLRLVREAVGAEAYLLGCGAPVLPSVGLVDAMRVSPDTFHEDAQGGQRGLRGAMSLQARRWQHGRLWANDPDCFVGRPSFALREEWADVVRRCGGLRSLSDRVADLDAWGLDTARELLASAPPLEPFPGEDGAR